MIWPDYTPHGAGWSARDLLAQIAGEAHFQNQQNPDPLWSAVLAMVEAVRLAEGPRTLDVNVSGPALEGAHAHLVQALVEAQNALPLACIMHLQPAIPV